MIRRSLRIGIRVGLLSCLAFALIKIVKARRTSPALSEGGDGWPFAMVPDPAPAPPTPAVTAPPSTAVRATPVTKAVPATKAAAKATAKGPTPAAKAAARAAAESAARTAVARTAVARAAVARAASAKGTTKPAANKLSPTTEAGAVRPPSTQASDAAWVQAQDGACPSSHPIKARLASRIFHLPGMAAYQRTAADRCYRDETSAEADGLRKAKR